MSLNARKSMSGTALLVLFGVAALFGGVASLALLIPAALLVWYGSLPDIRRERN